ncbi:MAG: hypothetical protein IKY53_04180 [Lachnospiraceae bacterium]|nr:hypothetical protein [Lachnospiraceae bacterium]
MKNHKKFLCLILITILSVLALTACSPVAEDVEKPLTIKASEMLIEDDSREAAVENAASEAAAELDALY